MYENDQKYSKKAKGNRLKTWSTYNEIWLSMILNKENVIIDTFLDELHLHDKPTNHFDIFSEKYFIYICFFKKRKIRKSYF